MFGLPETRPQHLQPAPLSGAFGQYRALLGNAPFMGYSLVGGVAMAGMFAYIAGSPFVFIELYGVPAERYGWLFGTNAAGFVIMAQVNARLVRRGGPVLWLQRMVLVYLLSALSLLVLAWMQPAQLWPLMVPLFICVACLGCVLPNATACAMAGQGVMPAVPRGCWAACSSAWRPAPRRWLHDGSAVPMALVIALCGAGACAMAWWCRRFAV